MNLLNDYKTICDYNVLIQNKGGDPQRFVVFYKAAQMLGLTLTLILLSIIMFAM